MEIHIDDSQSIVVVKAIFAKHFLYLKLEFFSIEQLPGEGTTKKYMESQQKKIGQCRTIHYAGTINITPEMTVAKLEQQFRHVFGLAVQVFRKSGSGWIETTVTGSWTLKKQNEQGQELSALKHKKAVLHAINSLPRFAN